MIQLKAKDCLGPWAIYVIVATIAGGLVGAVVGGVSGGIIAASGGSPTTIKIVAALLGFLIGLPFSFLIYWWTARRFLAPRIEKALSKAASELGS